MNFPDWPVIREPVLREALRHLPPSGSTLRLAVFGDQLVRERDRLIALRPDIQLLSIAELHGTSSVDAVLAHGVYTRRSDAPGNDVIDGWLRILRPGGRLIMIDPLFGWWSRRPITPESIARTLAEAGFARVLGERVAAGKYILSRGEKPYPTMDVAKYRDENTSAIMPIDGSPVAALPNPFIFLLIRQTPNVPIWSLPPHAPIRWEAALVRSEQNMDVPIVLAFTALPRAVAFMQPAVTADRLIGVTRIAKFHTSSAASWPFPILLNPTYDAVIADREYSLDGWLPIDPNDAVTGDE